MNNTADNNTNKRQAINSATMANTTDAGSNKRPAIDSIGGITVLNEDDYKQQLDGILLKQAIDILHELKLINVFKETGMRATTSQIQDCFRNC